VPDSILIADDDQRVRQVVRELLECAGYVCFEAADGLDALEKATSLAPSLIVLDVCMPKMNGIEVASRLLQRSLDAKVVLMTMYDVGQAFSAIAGVSAIVLKPEGVTTLVDCIRNLLGAATDAPPAPCADLPPTATAEPNRNTPYFPKPASEETC
jgi:CheY-like chemotaxis protein